MDAPAPAAEETLRIPAGGVTLDGDLAGPPGAAGVVLFAHGSGSSRHSSRNRYVAAELRRAGLATLLMDLLTPREEAADAYTGRLRFDIGLLAERLAAATDWLRGRADLATLPVGYFGASTGGGAALVAAAARPDAVAAVVSRGGRPDLAGDALPRVRAPTLLIVGGHDVPVIELNRQAYAQLTCEKRMEIVPGATHLFEEAGALEAVAHLATDWLARHLRAPLLALGLLASVGACGGGGIDIRGDFAGPGAAPAASVWAVEAEQGADVREGAFEIEGLVAGPVTLRLMAGGDTVGRIEIPDLPAGASVALRGLRVDQTSGLAFPASVELEGARAVLVNGIRMAPAGRVPSEVAVAGTVLAISDDADALLLRPDDAGLPDLRVVVGLATETVTPDGDPAEPAALAPGDSVRVEGRSDSGFVVASRLVVPRRTTLEGQTLLEGGEVEPSGDGGGEAGDGEGDDGGTEAAAAPVVAPARPAVVRSAAPARERP
ncbi:MAG TPA: dienelactone hydrolase family protein, partial [Longimicrobiaceae bacterium]|nr:dienelactone hydrolase family protein [Longimicrobiaceae bacterium]